MALVGATNTVWMALVGAMNDEEESSSAAASPRLLPRRRVVPRAGVSYGGGGGGMKEAAWCRRPSLGAQLLLLMFKKVLGTRTGATVPNRHRSGRGRRVPREPSARWKLGRDVLRLETGFPARPRRDGFGRPGAAAAGNTQRVFGGSVGFAAVGTPRAGVKSTPILDGKGVGSDGRPRAAAPAPGWHTARLLTGAARAGSGQGARAAVTAPGVGTALRAR